jgi:hypothetical protein
MKQYTALAHCIKDKGEERDAGMLGKKPWTKYEVVPFTLTVYNSRAFGHTGDYFFFTVVPLKHNRYEFCFLA